MRLGYSRDALRGEIPLFTSGRLDRMCFLFSSRAIPMQTRFLIRNFNKVIDTLEADFWSFLDMSQDMNVSSIHISCFCLGIVKVCAVDWT